MWPDIIKQELGDIEYHNYGQSGASNQFIAYQVYLADIVHEFNSDDLVMISWSSAFRNDWFIKGEFVLEGNAFWPGHNNQKLPSEMKDLDHYTIRDAKTIANITNYLNNNDCKSYQFAMLDNFNTLEHLGSDFGYLDLDILDHPDCKPFVDIITKSILPSFMDSGIGFKETQEFWESNIAHTPLLKRVVANAGLDDHPQPVQSLQYLETIFDYKFSDYTHKVVSAYQDHLNQVIADSIEKDVQGFLTHIRDALGDDQSLINFLD